MPEAIQKDEEKSLAERNPAPAKERPPETLEVKTVEPPPAPEAPDLSKKVSSLKAHEQELLKAVKKKDKAIQDQRDELNKANAALAEAEERAGESQEAPNLEDAIAETVRTETQKAVAAKMKDMEPLLEKGREARAEMDKQTVVGQYGNDTYEKFREQAESFRSQHPSLTLAQAFNQVVPRNSGADNAPATPVEDSRTPAPTQEPTAEDKFQDLLGEAGRLNASKRGSKGRQKIEEALKVRVSDFLKSRS